MTSNWEDQFEKERVRDLAAYEALKEDLLRDHLGRYAAIGNGRLVLVSDSFDEAFDTVRDMLHAFVFQVGEEPSCDIVYIRWRTVS